MADKLGQPWVFVGVGVVGIAIGAAVIASVTGVLPVEGRLQPGVTSFIVVCAGIVFAGIGSVFALTGFSETRLGSRVRARAPALFRLLNLLVALAALGSLATIASFAAVGPGPRAFSFTLPVVGKLWGAELVGRIFFGAIALVLWGVIAVLLWSAAKSLIGKK